MPKSCFCLMKYSLFIEYVSMVRRLWRRMLYKKVCIRKNQHCFPVAINTRGIFFFEMCSYTTFFVACVCNCCTSWAVALWNHCLGHAMCWNIISYPPIFSMYGAGSSRLILLGKMNCQLFLIFFTHILWGVGLGSLAQQVGAVVS